MTRMLGMAAALMALVACGGGTPAGQPVSPTATGERPATASPGETGPELGTIRVGYMPVLGFGPYMVAKEKGYFEKRGLDVELQSFSSGTQMIAPLATGDLDVGGGSVGPAYFNGLVRGLDVRIVAAAASQPKGFGATPILVRNELAESGEVDGPADLAGRRVGINVPQAVAEYLLAAYLAKADLTVEDVELVTLPFPEMPQALANAAVDAALLPHPLAARALRSGEAMVLVGGDDIVDNPQNGVVFFGRRLLEKRTDQTGISLLMALMEGARDLHGDGWQNPENVAILSRYTEIPPPAIQASVPYFVDPNLQLNVDDLVTQQNYLVRRGYVEFDRPLATSEFVDTRFLDAAVRRLGRFPG